ncbi:MAG: amino acid--tRNA ligase-related protein, partial [candidate division WWE3 bacterium]|nr:amino acid--tRNA ligase-related protein [candidate division WWE3 bacterium]
YVDLLVNPEVRQVFETRTKIINALRAYLNKHGAFEVETPILQSLYGGATARPFITHHNALDADFYLRISDELYLKRLIVGGFEFVYEFGKDFRNEGIDRAHNPEFTMLEFYWAWKDYQDLMQFTQEMISQVVKEVTGGYKVTHEKDVIDFTPPWKKMTFREAVLEQSGLDIEKFDTEEKLRAEVKKRKIALDLTGVVGYGALLDAFYKQCVRPKIVGLTILYDWPVEMVPLAKRKAGNPKLAESFQPLVKGMELLLAYSELNDPLDQRKRWEEEMKLARKGLEEHQVLDEDYIRALEYGMPPTAGWGLGIDRLVAILTGQHSLKDTILFPTLRPTSASAKGGSASGGKASAGRPEK